MANDIRFSDEAHSPGRGCLLSALSLLLLIAVVHGVLGFGGYLINEHRRLSHFETAALWFGDVIGLFWFLWYAIRWQLGLIDSEPRPLAEARFPKAAWIMLISLLVGFCAELAMTLSLRHEEYAGFQRAVPAVFVVDAIETSSGLDTGFYNVKGRYEDAAGTTHRVTFYLSDLDNMAKIPQRFAEAIRQKKAGLELPIVYDPHRPGRCWIPELGWDDGNRLHYFSFAILFFQFLGAMLFFTLLEGSIKLHKRLPWWSDLHCLLPLATEAFFLGLIGGLELYVIRRFGL